MLVIVGRDITLFVHGDGGTDI